MSSAIQNDRRLSQAQSALAEARRALQRGQRSDARRLAMQAASLAPELEDPWLLLAAVAAPKASLAYLQRALQINPNSPRARKGIEWAQQLLRDEQQPPAPVVSPPRPSARPEVSATLPPASAPAVTVLRPTVQEDVTLYRAAPVTVEHKRRGLRLALVSLAVLACLGLGFSAWGLGFVSQPAALAAVGELAGVAPRLGLRDFPATAVAMGQVTVTATIVQTPVEEILPSASPIAADDQLKTATVTPFAPLTDTPVPSLTPTSTPTSTPTETPLPTDIPTIAPPPTDVPAPPTQTAPPLEPTKKPKKVKPANTDGPAQRPAGVGADESWIDVDLSTQMTYAMVGDQESARFLVSTGRWPTVTVTGVFKIYVKYRYADMSGDDYYLHNVPYVMYFYKGYGLHGTFWHNNFGTPMSHGCVNLSPSDAGWLFDFARVGTIVNVHQ